MSNKGGSDNAKRLRWEQGRQLHGKGVAARRMQRPETTKWNVKRSDILGLSVHLFFETETNPVKHATSYLEGWSNGR